MDRRKRLAKLAPAIRAGIAAMVRASICSCSHDPEAGTDRDYSESALGECFVRGCAKHVPEEFDCLTA